MTQEEINKAFEGRWCFKAQHIDEELETLLIEYRIDFVKKLCRDFFETAILLCEGNKENEIISGTMINPSDNGFVTWWNMYGKKIDRAKCEKKWNRLTAAEKRACIEATPAYVASTPDIQYRRHPMTYLNNKSWENQIIPRNNATDTKLTIEQQRISKLADILAGRTE